MAMLFRTLGSPARLLVPSFALALFGAYHVIWSRPAQIAVAVDHETDLYFGIAEPAKRTSLLTSECPLLT